MRLSRPFAIASWRGLPKEARYLGVGAICAVTNNALMLLLAGAGFNYAWSCFLAMPPMFFIGYGLHVFVTFRTEPSLGAFLRFCLTIVMAYPAAVTLLFVLCDLMKLPFPIAAPVSTVLMIVWNYVFTHWAMLQSIRGAFR